MLELLFCRKPTDTTPVGQIKYTTAGTYSWVVPDNCTSICVALVASGGGRNFFYGSGPSGNYYWGGGGGGGGGYSYVNDIPVTPGETLTITLGAAGAQVSAVNTQGGRGGDAVIKRGSTMLGYATGGYGGTCSSAAGQGGIGGAGGKNAYTSNTGGKNGNAGGNGVAGEGRGSNATGTSSVGDNSTLYGGGQALGAIRIIWGKGRAFPSTLVTDQKVVTA